MITKELASIIVQHPVDEIVQINNSEIICRELNKLGSKHNIYELAYKCKEWAYSRGYTLQIIWMSRTKDKIWYEVDVWTIEPMLNKKRVSEEETEPEAIFQACQWILDNKGYQ